MERFFATCPRGLELLLADELRSFGAEKVHGVGGGVQFVGEFFLCCRVNLESRLASRILWQVTAGRYGSEEDIYRVAFAVPWNQWFDPGCTIRVDVSATKSPLTSLNFVTLKIKDAVCDKIRRLSGRRLGSVTCEMRGCATSGLSARERHATAGSHGRTSRPWHGRKAFPR